MHGPMNVKSVIELLAQEIWK